MDKMIKVYIKENIIECRKNIDINKLIKAY